MLDVIGAAGAAEPGVGGQRGGRVTGQLDLGDDGDIAVGGIFDDVADLVLCIIAAIFGAVVADTGGVADDGAAAAGADFGEEGIFFDLDAPALVFGEVPVEIVHFMQGDEVDIAFDEFDGEEVAAAVEVEAAPGEAGVVVDGDGGNGETCGV